ncbi:response regulator transcription factor [Micromonospora sp. NPDC023956]|uniref:response regulator transcription factor n=1 Tax=Micromonospora sp. NPDC023956 TaxID=3155722 RepID=UPI0033EAD149
MTGAPVRVLLADDEPLFRGTVRRLVDATPGMAVAGEAGTGREAVALAAAHRCDVVVMDVRMPDLDGIAATARITALPDPPRVLVLTAFDLDDHVYRALRAGASGFVFKDITPVRLVNAIRTVAAGESLFAPSVTRRLIAHSVPRRVPRRRLDGVTPRECEVLALITRGLSNDEIGAALHISRGTLKTHIGSLLAKLAARDRAQLVIAGYEAGLADP